MRRPTKEQVDAALQSLEWNLAPQLLAISAQVLAAEVRALRVQLDAYRVEPPPGIDAGDFLRAVNALVKAALELADWCTEGVSTSTGGRLTRLREALLPFQK